MGDVKYSGVHKIGTFQQQCFSVCGIVFPDDRVAATKTCQNIAWLYKYVHSVGPACRQ